MPKEAVTLGLVAALLVGGYWGLLFVGQRRMLFPRPVVAGAPQRPAEARELWLATPSGAVEAWYLPPIPVPQARAPILLFFHGNGELIDFWPAMFDEPRRWGLGVLLVEYPGYGRSAGSPSESTIGAAALAAYDWAAAQSELDPQRIVAHGRSLGGGAACLLALQRPVAALVLESSFTSVRDMALRFGAPGFMVRDPFDNLTALERYEGPLLIVHGRDDEIIPVEHGRRLARAARRAELHVIPCGHNDCPRPWPWLSPFLDAHGILGPPAAG